MLGGGGRVRGHAPSDFFFIKMLQSGAFPGVPKYVIINLKLNNFKDHFS